MALENVLKMKFSVSFFFFFLLKIAKHHQTKLSSIFSIFKTSYILQKHSQIFQNLNGFALAIWGKTQTQHPILRVVKCDFLAKRTGISGSFPWKQ